MKYLSSKEKKLLYFFAILYLISAMLAFFMPTIGTKEQFEDTDYYVRVGVSPFNLLLDNTEASAKIMSSEEGVDLINQMLSFSKINVWEEMTGIKSFYSTFSTWGVILVIIMLVVEFFFTSINPLFKGEVKLKQKLADLKIAKNIYNVAKIFFDLFMLLSIIYIALCIFNFNRNGVPDIATIGFFYVVCFSFSGAYNVIYKKAKKELEYELSKEEASNFQSWEAKSETSKCKNEFTKENYTINNMKERAAILAEYKKLLDNGVITQEEYEKKKKELLKLW